MVTLEFVDSCPVCGGEGAMDIDGVKQEGITLNMYSCKNCHTAYHNPRMSQDAMLEYYSSGRYRDYPGRKIDETVSVRRIAQTVGLIEAFARIVPNRCLDVGCSRGYLSKALHDKYGVETIGYDIYDDPDAVIEVVHGKDEIDGTFDLITCIHVLEHLYDPMGELAWMASLLNENGMLVIEIPLARVVTAPHPVIFSREAVPILMKHINAEYIFVDMQVINIGYILAWSKKHERIG